MSEFIEDPMYEGGRWVRPLEPTWFYDGMPDVFHPAPHLRDVVAMGIDVLNAPHSSARSDVLMFECRDAAQRLINVVTDPDEENGPNFVAAFLATLVIEIARREDATK